MENSNYISSINNFNKKHQLTGYINNINGNSNLNGDGLEQNDEIDINNIINKNYELHSQDNNIIKYDNKEQNSAKYQKNNEYSSEILLDKNNFSDKKYLIKNIEGDVDFNSGKEFDKNNIENNNRISTISSNNYNYDNYENYIRQRKSTEKDEDDIMIDDIINRAKNGNNNDVNFIEKPDNVNGNDIENDNFDEDDEFS